MAKTPSHILRIDASMRRQGSVTRALTDAAIARLRGPETTVTVRDLAEPLPFVDETWIAATFTPPTDRTPEQRAALALSETLVAELEAADTLVIGAPMYNFFVPAAFKAWFDLIARAGETFRYTEHGPVGLLEGKRAIVVSASGGVPTDSPADFAAPWMRHVLGFVGITDVTIISADRLMSRDDAVGDAEAAVAALTA
ncbi:MAG: NAD(P)H-dependent oxidoreductase [Pseudomonadota bacterium]